MSKKTKKKKSPYAYDGKVKIRHSYYTFSKEYPSRILPFEGKRRKYRKKRAVKSCLTSLLLLLLACLSYFTVNLLLDISYAEPVTADSSAVQPDKSENEDTEQSALPFGGEKVRALYMPCEKMGDKEYIRELIKEIKAKNGNSVLIDFKTEEGRLLYSSMNEYAINAGCALFDNNTVRESLDIFEEKGIKVIARIYCFEDSIISAANEELAVKYMDTDANWLDVAGDGEGKSRLNPCSAKAKNYLKDIINEVLSFKVDGILLESVSFPSGEHISSATYPGENKKSERNTTLKAFISQVNALLSEDCILLLGHSASDVLEVNRELYFGEMLTGEVDGFAVDTAVRDEKYIIDKKTDFVSVFSLFSSVKEALGEKTAVYRIDMTEYSAAYLRSMIKSGYDSFILFSEDGVY